MLFKINKEESSILKTFAKMLRYKSDLVFWENKAALFFSYEEGRWYVTVSADFCILKMPLSYISEDKPSIRRFFIPAKEVPHFSATEYLVTLMYEANHTQILFEGESSHFVFDILSEFPLEKSVKKFLAKEFVYTIPMNVNRVDGFQYVANRNRHRIFSFYVERENAFFVFDTETKVEGNGEQNIQNTVVKIPTVVQEYPEKYEVLVDGDLVAFIMRHFDFIRFHTDMQSSSDAIEFSFVAKNGFAGVLCIAPLRVNSFLMERVKKW